MKTSTRRAAAVLAITLATLGVASCSKSDSADTTVAAETEAAVETEAAAVETEAAATETEAAAVETEAAAMETEAAAATGDTLPAGTKIVFGTDATYPPFESAEADGTIVGFDIDIAKAVCEEIKAECTFVNQAWDGIIPALLAKKYDAIVSSMSITPERMKSVSFTQKLYSAPQEFAGKEGMTIDATPEGLKGKSIGSQQGTIQADYIKKHFPDATLKEYPTVDDAYSDLTAGRIDLVFIDAVQLEDGFLKTDNGKGFVVLGDPVPSSADPEVLGAGTGMAVRPDDAALLNTLNAGISAIRSNGKYDEVAKKYFNFDIYGG